MSTKIEWANRPGTTGEVWNPTTGCSHVSPGCEKCYAERLATRFGFTAKPWSAQNAAENVVLHPERLDLPLRWRKPRTVFVNSMSDLFHPQVPDRFIDRVFAVMALTPQHTFIVLTKRPERMRSYLAATGLEGRIARAMDGLRVPVFEGEEWLPIQGYLGYSVSTLGRVASAWRNAHHILRMEAGDQGHLRVRLYREDSGPHGDRKLVHRLVLEAFAGAAPDEKTQACHLDGNPANNRVTNLRWGSQSENWDDRIRHGHFRAYSKLTDGQVTDIRRRGRNGETAYSIAKDFPVSDTQVRNILKGAQWVTEPGVRLPLSNCWLGVSVEDQRRADERIPLLKDTPAAVRFLSCEPLLGPIDFRIDTEVGPDLWLSDYEGDGISWLIAGGESGPGARPCRVEWIRSIADQCRATGTSVFVKQASGPRPGMQGDIPDDLWIKQWPEARP